MFYSKARFILKHVYKSYSKALIEPRSNPGLIYALFVEPGLEVFVATSYSGLNQIAYVMSC